MYAVMAPYHTKELCNFWTQVEMCSTVVEKMTYLNLHVDSKREKH